MVFLFIHSFSIYIADKERHYQLKVFIAGASYTCEATGISDAPNTNWQMDLCSGFLSSCYVSHFNNSWCFAFPGNMAKRRIQTGGTIQSPEDIPPQTSGLQRRQRFSGGNNAAFRGSRRYGRAKKRRECNGRVFGYSVNGWVGTSPAVNLFFIYFPSFFPFLPFLPLYLPSFFFALIFLI